MPLATVLPFEKAYMPVGAAPSPQAELIVAAGHGKRAPCAVELYCREVLENTK
jgi:hypothetical protein